MKIKTTHSAWESVRLSDIIEFKNGINKEKRYFGQGSPIVNYVDVYRGGGITSASIAGKVEANTSEISRYNIQRGDTFFTRTSETLKEIGLSAVALEDMPNAVFSGFVLRGRPKKGVLLPGYSKYCFTTPLARQEIMEKSSYTTRALTSGGSLGHVRLNLPRISEQVRIVSVLETWDGAAEKLAKMLELKKIVKASLMQQLLTGRKRIPGFSMTWKMTELGELCKIKTGGKDNQDKVENGRYPFFVRSPHVEQIDSYAYDGEAILVPGEGNIGKIFHYINGKFNWHQRVYKISDFNERALGKYIYYYFVENFAKQVNSGSVKATVDSLRLPTFTKFLVNLPPLDEQKAIAAVLTAADDEIAELEKKLALVKEQRKFLLNNLVTGKIRTPEDLKMPSKEAVRA